ncbi:FHDC1 protein, partial [Acromyrmex insinuator]
MDSHVGLDYIVDNPEYCVKLASALETACPSVKKQVVELLSALCVYSQDGRQRAIDTLHTYQERKGERYRLRVVVDELQKATSEDYQTALLAFINCLVISTPVLKDRIRIRNEFIGLKLLPILNELRKSHASDVRVQLNAFDYQQEADEELTNHGPPGIDLSSHVDVFYAILGQVADTPQEIPFLSVLQHLLRLDPKDAASDLAWDIAETLVHRATLLESREDATKLLRSPSLQMNLCCHCRGPDQMCGTSRKTSLSTSNNSTAPLPPPPPPPIPVTPSPSTLPSGNSFVLPPPPPPLLFVNVAMSDASMETMMPPPLHVSPVTRAPTPELPSNHARLLPQQEIPTPKTKMKTINWNKIPNHKVIGKRNIWSLVANDYQNSTMSDLDWAEMEGLFCQQVPPMVLPANYSTSYGTGVDIERRRREPTEIALLDGKRSLNVSIFLKQFRSSNENIIQLIKEGGHDDIGAEKLRGLLKILPEVDELEMLKSFDGDKSKLGNAEKFFLQLIQVPNYKLRIECMLLKEEFAANMSYLELSINSMILAGEDLMTNKLLQEVLYMVLIAGNFLNSGGYAGNAAGVKLSSLQKLTEIRANKPGMNLIHYVALQAERKRKNLLSFAKNITALEAATKTTIEQLTNEFNSLDTKIIKIKSQIQFSSTENDIQEQMAQFLQMAEREMAQLKRDMEELEGVRRSLAEFFCEDMNTFKIEECFRIFHQFYQKFNQAITENERRRIQEEQVLARRKQREEQLLARKRLLNNQAEMPVSESESNLMDHGLFDLHTGLPQRNYSRSEAKMRRNCGITGIDVSDEDVSVIGSPNIRRRLGSCPGGSDHQSIKEDTYSPDITPNGTLRRRRSRIPCEDDGNLMDFLRTSGQDNTRERKSWGSLDRSWARRARGQSRRGDLLNADFSGDRERPSSPAPLAESKPFLQEEEAKPTGKAWRQKIEEWLSENEKEDRADEQLQRRTKQLHQANRRSFEDSESEGKSFPMNTSGEDQIMLEERSSSKVYDWRPSVEKTDVMRTMEAIEEVQISSQDKSPWRKSSLNLSSNTEEIDPRYSRKNGSRSSMENALVPSTLQAITEEDRKKNKISDVINLDTQDELTIYLRQPYTGTQAPATRRFFKLGRKSADKERINDKIEIDSDNIETPPAIRRLFSPSKDVKPVEKEPCKRERCNSSLQGRETKTAISKWIGTDLGTGNFDRYSATRRTRRYRKTLDLMGNKDKSNVLSLEMVHDEKSTVQQPNTLARADEEIFDEDADAMLRIWQDKLKRRDTALMETARSDEDLQCLSHSVPTTTTSTMGHKNSRLPVSQPLPVLAVTNTVLSPVMQESRSREPVTVITERAVTSRERHRSMIDPSQVKEAVRLSSNPPSQVNQNQEIINDFSRNGNSLRDRKDDILEIVEEEKCVDLKSTGGTREFEKVRTVDDPCDQTAIRQNSIFRNRLVPDVSVTTSPLSGKSRDQELNDEGFEETQSLVSETLSQETSSGNYETDTHDLMRCSPAELGGYSSENPRRSAVDDDNLDGRKSSVDKLLMPASGKTFNEKTIARNASKKSNFLPKRTASAKHESSALRKIESLKRTSNVVPLNDTEVSKSEVQRSSSRSSLRSSRSSLNSATSVNTVRNLAANRVHLQNYTSAIRALTNDLRKNSPLSRPLPSKDAIDKRRSSLRQMGTSKIPASRSNNSSSNIGPAIRSVQKESEVVPGMPKVTRGRPIASRSSSSGSSVGQQSILGNRLPSGDKTYATKSRLMQPRISLKGHSFMRPTAASVNKGSTTNLPKNIKVVVKGYNSH